jgi:hypothetical protein
MAINQTKMTSSTPIEVFRRFSIIHNIIQLLNISVYTTGLPNGSHSNS